MSRIKNILIFGFIFVQGCLCCSADELTLTPVPDTISEARYPDVESVIGDQCGGEVITLPSGDFSVPEPIELDGQVLVGAYGKTRLHPAPGVTAIVIRSNPEASRRWDAVFDPKVRCGAGVEGVHIVGTRQGQTGIKTRGPCDQIKIDSVTVKDCDGGGLLLNPEDGFTRESSFTLVVCDRCGSKVNPAVGIYQRESKSGDGTNNCNFTDFRIVYSYGIAVLVRNDDKDERIRNLRFRGMFHMQSPNANQRFSLVVCEGSGPISGLSLDGHWRGDDKGVVPCVRLSKLTTDCRFTGTSHFKAGSFGTVLVR